ncbi:uncharacterized protein LOC117100827 [Anneissia japonica]|uniref:uncharacterized protein LOC117100827 n=1 Tax=Anneissia japonica TaxID=1529436 RepID=UPI0014258121|nr:uncharacterized protein LOC117100827 [Anneissia japonica]
MYNKTKRVKGVIYHRLMVRDVTMLSLAVAVLLLAAHPVDSTPSAGRENVCSRQVSIVTSRQVSYSVSSRTTGKTNCGFWGWSRCTTYSRRYSRAYRIGYYSTYSRNYFCCTGWAEDGLGGCPIPICSPQCGVGGTCVSPDRCSCRSGFSGLRCSDINECNENNGGCQHLCVNTEGSYYCQCYMGYDEVGGQCEAVCQPPCIHGECTAPNYCECEGDYVGDRCPDLNECLQDNGGCAHICTNFHGGFRCECLSGYVLSTLTECLPNCDPPCENNGQCSSPSICDCPEGYNGDRCEKDINECLVNNGGCEQVCNNYPGSFSCSCSDGYTGTTNCTDIDECTFASCHNCTNSPGSFECICKEGYQVFDLYNCEDVDECATGIGGCSQNCSNTIGSFICDCHDGWTLNSDGKSCNANPCVIIGVPYNGIRNCTGFTTGESCVFECAWNYRLLGSNKRKCLSNGDWDGQVTQCEEILCPELSLPNGYIFFPCENTVGSRCNFGCDFGYFLEEDIVTQCQRSGLWNSSAPVCTEIELCKPSPCVNGVCRFSQNEADGYFCDCSGTGYTGRNCEDGFVTTPVWPEIWVGNVYHDLEFTAKPKQTIELKIVTDPDRVIVHPTQLFFTPNMKNQKVSIRGVGQGFTKISYVMRGKGAAAFTSPNDDELFVFQNNTPNNGYVYGKYFTPRYQFPSGCFELSDKSICSGVDVNFTSTKKWTKTKNSATQTLGVVSIATNTFELPLNLIGHSTISIDTTTDTVLANCQIEGITLDGVQDFVKLSSLYRKYTQELENILPDWITFISVKIDPGNSKTSFSTLILNGNEVKSIEWCSSAPVISDGQYSVYLLYKAELNIGGRYVSLPLSPYKGKYCFLVGVCSVTSGTVMMMFPEGSRDLLAYMNDVDPVDFIDVEVNGLGFSTTDKLDPNGRYSQAHDDNKISFFANLQYTFNINKTVSAKLEGSGDIYVTLENVTQLFSHLFTQRWQIQQFGNSTIRLPWQILGQDVSLEFKSNKVKNPILNASFGNYSTSEYSSTRGIVMKSSTSHSVFDDTPFSWLLKPQKVGTPAEVFVYYDLTPSLSIPSDLNGLTQIINKLRDIPKQLSTLAEQLLTYGYSDMYVTPILSTTNYLEGSINNYFQVLSLRKSIGNSLSEIRIQCKEILKSLRYLNDTLFSNQINQYNNFQINLQNITQQLEEISNQVLTEVQNIFVYETAAGSGFRMTSEVCLSPYLCFPLLEVKVSNYLSNSSWKECTELQTDPGISEICVSGKYTAKETLNRFITIPNNAKLSLALQTNDNHWIGNIPVLTKLLGIEQMTMMHLAMSGTYFNLSGKLWGFFNMKGNVTSKLDSFESMILHVNGDMAVEGPSSLGRIMKDKIITLSQKLVQDSEQRLEQGVKSVKMVKSRLDVVLEEKRLKKANVDRAEQKYASAESDLLTANINVKNTRESLDDQHDYTKEIEDQLNSVCKVHNCSGVCLPGRTIVTVTKDVYAYVPYQCCADRTEPTVIEETTSCCSSCVVATPVKKTSLSLDPFKLVVAGISALTKNWIKAGVSLVSSVKIKRGQRLSYSKSECCENCKKPVEIEVMFTSCSTCVDYLIVGQTVQTETQEVECSTQVPDANCVRRNEECRQTRNRLFDRLKLETPDLAALIEDLDYALQRASLAEAALNGALIELQDAIGQHEEVLSRVFSLQEHLNNTQNALNKISKNVGAGLAIQELQINGSIEANLEFKKLEFDIDLVGEETTIIPVVCHLTLASDPVQIQIVIDLNNLDYTIENGALFMTEVLFGDITRSVRRRREASQSRFGLVHHRKRRETNMIIEQPMMDTVSYNVINNISDYNISSIILRDQRIVQNEARCQYFNDTLSFVEHSFQMLLEIANFSKVAANVPGLENVDNFHSEYIYNLSTSSETANASAAFQFFNLTTDDIQYLNSSLVDGLEQNALTKVIDSAKMKANNTKLLLEVDDVLSRWEVVMETYTRNFSGMNDCEGFHDCLTTELIGLKYLSEDRQIYEKVIILDDDISRMLDKTTLNVNEAVTGANNILNQIHFLKNTNDICLRKPTVTKHPEAKVVTVEGNDVTITCQASGNPSPTFSWTFNGETLSGIYTHSLLLKQVNATDSGTYTCHASNEVTSVQSEQCQLTVEFPPSIIKHPQDADIEQGNPEGIYFTCQASALPLPNYQWYFQALSTSTMEAISGENASGIEILSPTFRQEGWYTCEAWNAHGRQMSNRARLNILGVSIPEFSSDVTITLYRLDDSNTTLQNDSLRNGLSEVISVDEPELERLNYKESSPAGKTFLTEISFDVKSTNVTPIDIVNASREELAYLAQDKIESVRVKVAELNDLLTPGDIFEHRGEIFEVTRFIAGINGPICPNTQYAHQDGYICVHCPPGSYRGNDKLPATCEHCPSGFYQPEEGQAECLVCNSELATEPGSRRCLLFSHKDEEVSPSGIVTSVSNGISTPWLFETDAYQLNGKILVYAIGGGLGGFAILISVIGVIVCHHRKKNKSENKDIQYGNDCYNSVGNLYAPTHIG